MSLIDMLRAEARLAPVSGIEAVANYGRGRPGLIPLWAGEGDLPTPDFINAAAMRGARRRRDLLHLAGRHPGACARRSPAITQRHFGRTFRPDEFFVTDRRHAGDPAGACTRRPAPATRSIYLTPAWPNFAGAAGVAGASPVPVALDRGRQWLVLRRRQASRPRSRRAPRRSSSTRRPTRPAGPPTRETLQAILDLARRHGPLDHRRRDLRAVPLRRTAARRPSWTSWSRRTASSSSTPSPRTGR